MGFIQIIEFRTSKFDEVQKTGEEWEASTSGETTARRRVLCRDRDEDRYFNVVFFDSYEEAMANSESPVTQEFSQKMMELADGPPTFYNLDVVEDRTLG